LRIGFWGPFGTHNLGNECTLYAMLSGARRHVPTAELVGVCNDPRDTTERHGVRAVPIAVAPEDDFLPLPGPLRKLRRPVWEVGDWLRVIRSMRTLDMLVVTGTGIITDEREGATGMPYQMFKWVIAARLAGRKVKFVSVGAEKLIDPVKLFFLRWSLRLAEYRSYRDGVTRKRAAGLWPLAERDPLYPDLAFSMPEALMRDRPTPPAGARTVAVGIYTVHGGEAALRAYVEKIGSFVLWLLEHGYRTRIVLGDNAYDGDALVALRSWLASRQALERVIDEPVRSFEELMDQLAEADLVVATRFHNVLLSLLLEKPVVSISHMDKNDELMAAMGLSAYCRGLDQASSDDIVQLFLALEANADSIRSLLKTKLEQFRNELEQQYDTIFGELASSRAAEAA
jgi:polysaccharide pyruvyl transferase WcaK-like protein